MGRGRRLVSLLAREMVWGVVGGVGLRGRGGRVWGLLGLFEALRGKIPEDFEGDGVGFLDGIHRG